MDTCNYNNLNNWPFFSDTIYRREFIKSNSKALLRFWQLEFFNHIHNTYKDNFDYDFYIAVWTNYFGYKFYRRTNQTKDLTAAYKRLASMLADCMFSLPSVLVDFLNHEGFKNLPGFSNLVLLHFSFEDFRGILFFSKRRRAYASPSAIYNQALSGDVFCMV